MDDLIVITFSVVAIFLNVAMLKWFHNNNLSRALAIVAIVIFVIAIVLALVM